MNKFTFLKVYFSPFKFIKPTLYIGKLRYGTPYFFPRRWIKNKDKKGYLIAIPKKIGFDFVDLGWKTKWEVDDYKHEWNPIWSFVFFKWQIAVMFIPKVDNSNYWECWLYYSRNTDKNKPIKEKIKEAREGFPCVWKSYYGDGKEETICYWDNILKNKYL